MEKQEREKYSKKIALYKKLGAEQFQDVVFEVEKIKFKVLKKLFPNFLRHYDKYCNAKMKRELKKATTDEERNSIRRKYQFIKMAMRKEWNLEQNRNYHMDPNHPTQIYPYLEWNKQIHKNALIKDAIVIPILVAGTIMNIPGAVVLLIAELFSGLINFECINIQNYNICRYKIIEEQLVRREQKKIESRTQKYGEAAKVVCSAIESKEELPTFDEIISKIETKEQLEQMKKLVIDTLKTRGIEEEEIAKQKTKNRGNEE